MDRSWMLNPKAIRTAKECILIVKREKGIKLMLAHPEFMDELHVHVEGLNSHELSGHYALLLSMAGVGNVVKHIRKPVASAPEYESELKAVAGDAPVLKDEMVEYQGRFYPRWKGEREFKSLYRGQALYV